MFARIICFGIINLTAFSLLLPGAGAQTPSPVKITFKKTVLDTSFRSEGVAVGDFNRDGKADIAAGTVWYEAPGWKMRLTGEKAPEYDPLSYSHAFQTFADDLNGDGWTDLLVVDWPGAMTWWLENPKQANEPWKQHIVTPVTNNESPQFVDIDGDGKRDLLAPFSPDPKDFDGPLRRMGFMTRTSDPNARWTIHAVSQAAAPSTKRYSHGIGLGDINGDGRKDILCKEGWWEAPVEKSDAEWAFHSAPLGEDCAQMYAFDIDGDGDNDVLSTAAHKVGMWWHEQLGNDPAGSGKWQTHQIDDSFTQTHALCTADINGDGLTDFVTGKRWWAHGPKGDINPGDPAVLFWFELQRRDGKPSWVPHQIDHDSGVGTQFEVADVNGDGLLDVVTSNKKGVRYFEQTRQ
jgi:VCBS repeat protein/FG-GAP repeat protein